jgi:hypothetical protein
MIQNYKKKINLKPKQFSKTFFERKNKHTFKSVFVFIIEIRKKYIYRLRKIIFSYGSFDLNRYLVKIMIENIIKKNMLKLFI